MLFMYILSWLASIFHLLFFTLSLAAGLYYIAEAVEEYTSIAAKLTSGIFACLYFIEGMPLYIVGIGLLSNLDYYLLLKNFPYISITSPTFIIGAAMVFVNHYLAFQYFATVYYSFSEILAYFTLCLWIVPFSFFVSLSINEYTLPTMQTTNQSHQLGSNSGDNLFQRPKRSGLLGMFDYIAEKKDRIKDEFLGRNKMY